jgi:3-hydroxyacyl-CoA dehydrogenase
MGSEQRNRVAVVTLDNPPVNALSVATRRRFFEGIEDAELDDGIRAIVITGAGRMFSGGADIREFNTADAGQAPSLADLIAKMEGCAKPVVAALNGPALGGGLELALGAHYRIAAHEIEVGLPEVTLGLLPGAGGTQRLPRAVGLETALNMIVSGAPAKARDLAHTQLFDRIVDGDVVACAVAFAEEAAARDGRPPRLRDRPIAQDNVDRFLAFARANVAKATNLPAPQKCVDALAAAVERPFDAGIAFEREAFIALSNTSESKAMRHAFFAERAASKVADIGSDVKTREVRAVGVIGAGTMGGGIAMSFLNAGLPVTVLESTPEALARGLATIRRNYENSAHKGKLTERQVEQRMALLQPTLSYDDLRNADLIVEAVFEEYAVKQAVFQKLDAVAKPGAILASNTSTLDVDRLAACTSRPRDVLGMHFFSPANVMKLLEIVRGKDTAKDVLATALAVGKAIRKTAVVARVCDGFIGNRMLEPYLRQAGFLLDEGALPQQVDRAIEKFGMAMGPFRMSDLAGNDIGWAIRKRRRLENASKTYSQTADLLCELGRFGQKTGKGWYDYKPGDRTAHPSPEVDALIERHSADVGLARRTIGDDEIVERLMFALANEGALIVEEGIAAKTSDIDIVYIAGYGFPVWRGGPMFHADSVGLDNVLAAMMRFAKGYQGQAWKPAPLLVRLAEAGKSFNA